MNRRSVQRLDSLARPLGRLPEFIFGLHIYLSIQDLILYRCVIARQPGHMFAGHGGMQGAG